MAMTPIPLTCVRCKKDDALKVAAVGIFNGTSLCRKHADQAQEETEELDRLFLLDFDEDRPPPDGSDEGSSATT